MLDEIAVASIKALYEDISEALRMKRKMDLPALPKSSLPS